MKTEPPESRNAAIPRPLFLNPETYARGKSLIQWIGHHDFIVRDNYFFIFLYYSFDYLRVLTKRSSRVMPGLTREPATVTDNARNPSLKITDRLYLKIITFCGAAVPDPAPCPWRGLPRYL